MSLPWWRFLCIAVRGKSAVICVYSHVIESTERKYYRASVTDDYDVIDMPEHQFCLGEGPDGIEISFWPCMHCAAHMVGA